MTLNTVLVDDEPLARERLKLLLADESDVTIVAECRNGREAIAQLQAQPADLLFLDIQMPGIGGFDVVSRIGVQHLPPTVFVTAYQDYAVKAFDVHAIDYLTKPVEVGRLRAALMRVREKIAAKAALLTQAQLTEMLEALRQTTNSNRSLSQRFLVRDGVKDILLAVRDIDWVEAADYYCCIHTGGRNYMLRETIKELAAKLDPSQFVRIHRSAIVNLDRIREIHRDGRAEASVVLLDGHRLRMSKAGCQKLLETPRH